MDNCVIIPLMHFFLAANLIDLILIVNIIQDIGKSPSAILY